MRKVFVDVTVEFSKEGQMKPVSFKWEDGCTFEIDRVYDCRRAASLKTGGQGLRYTCRVMGKKVYLFFEDDKWFIEGSG